MKACHTLHNNKLDEPNYPYFITAKGVIDYVEKLVKYGMDAPFNYWKMPDKELKKLDKYHKKVCCESDYKAFGNFKFMKSRQAKILEKLK